MVALPVRSASIHWCLAFCLPWLIAIPLLATTEPARAEGGDDALQAILEAYRANRDSFQTCTCRFRVVRGAARTLEDGWAGKIEVMRDQQGELVIHQGNLRYHLECAGGPKSVDDLPLPENRWQRFVAVDCLDETVLHSTGADISATYGVLDCVNLLEKKQSFALQTPFTLGVMGPGERNAPDVWIQDSLKGKRRCKHLGTESLDGRTVDVVECRPSATNNSPSKTVWYLDRESGAAVVRCVVHDHQGKLRFETRTENLKKMSNGGVVCGKATTIFADAPGHYSVSIITLTHIDLAVPSREAFGIPLRKGAEVVNVKDMRSFFKLDRAETVYANELAKWIKRCDEQLRKRIQAQGPGRAKPKGARERENGPLSSVTRSGRSSLELGAEVGLGDVFRQVVPEVE